MDALQSHRVFEITQFCLFPPRRRVAVLAPLAKVGLCVWLVAVGALILGLLYPPVAVLAPHFGMFAFQGYGVRGGYILVAELAELVLPTLVVFRIRLEGLGGMACQTISLLLHRMRDRQRYHINWIVAGATTCFVTVTVCRERKLSNLTLVVATQAGLLSLRRV